MFHGLSKTELKTITLAQTDGSVKGTTLKFEMTGGGSYVYFVDGMLWDTLCTDANQSLIFID